MVLNIVNIDKIPENPQPDDGTTPASAAGNTKIDAIKGRTNAGVDAVLDGEAACAPQIRTAVKSILKGGSTMASLDEQIELLRNLPRYGGLHIEN